MRKNIIKCFLLVCVMLISFAIVVGAEEATVYVASTGSDSAAGTADAPVATLDKAISMLEEGGTIKLIDDILLGATAEKYFLEPAHSGKITVTSADVNNKGGIVFSADCSAYYFNGDAEWNNILVRANVTSGVNISCENNKVTMGEGLEMSHTTGASAGTQGGHAFDGTKIYIFASYFASNGHTAAGTGDVGGGELRIYSGEYWYVGAWRATSGSVTGGETLIVVDGKDGDIWMNNLCPVACNTASTAFTLAADVNGNYPHNVVFVGDNINVNYAYRISQGKLSGTTNVDWLIKGELYGDSTARKSQTLTPVSPFSLVANVYLDTSDAETVADATTFMANWSATFGGDHDINNTLDEYCLANGHSMENYVCEYCGLTVADATVYVASTGSDSAAGTADAPVATLDKAISMLEEGGTIKLIDDILLGATAEKYFLEPAHSGKITVTSADVNNKGGIVFSADCSAYYFNGDAEWNNILVRANITSGVNISCENNKVTMGEGLEMSHTTGATAGTVGGHTFDGTKIYIFASYFASNGHTAAGTGDVGGGELRIYSGEYWYVGAWRAASGSVTGGETLILVDCKDGDIWLNNLCPTNLNSASTAFSLAADSNGKYPHNIVYVGENVNVNYVYRITMGRLSGTTNVDWLLKGELYGDSTVRSSQTLTPVSPFSLVANVYLDTSDAETVADATTFLANWSAAFGGDHNIDNTLDEYCSLNTHLLEDGKCLLCNSTLCDMGGHDIENCVCKVCGFASHSTPIIAEDGVYRCEKCGTAVDVVVASLEDCEVKKGTTVRIPIKVKGTDFWGATWTVDAPYGFELTGFEANTVDGVIVRGAPDIDLPYTFAVISNTTYNTAVDETVATLIFEVSKFVEDGEYIVSISTVEAIDIDKNDLLSVASGAKVTVNGIEDSIPADGEAIFVSESGTGDGTSSSAPMCSLVDAYASLKDGGNIFILGNYTVENVEFPEVNGDVTIRGYSLTVNGNIEFAKNNNSNVITLDLPVDATSGATIFGGFNSIVFGENFDVIGTLDFYGGVDAVPGTQGEHDANYALNATMVTELPYSITVKNGTFDVFAGGNKRAYNNTSDLAYMGNTDLLGSIAAPITVTIDGGVFNKSFSLSGNSFLADDATLTVNGGTFNCPVYAQGSVGLIRSYASYCSRLVMSDKKYYAIDGDILFNLAGGTFNGGIISVSENDAVYTQCVRGNFTLTVGDGAKFASTTILDATQVKAYEGESAVATLVCPDASKFTIKRFDNVNGEAVEYEEPLRIAFIGDSITEGVGSTDQLTKSYSAQFKELCKADGRDVIIGNYGVGGSAILPYGNGYYNNTLAYSLAYNEADADYVLIAIGTNDAQIAGGTIGQMMQFTEMYEDFVRSFGDLNTTKKVFTTSAIYRLTSNKPADVRAVSVIRPTQKLVSEKLMVEDADKYVYVDLYALLYDAAVTDELFASDKLHPDDGGYVIYGKVIYDAIFNRVYSVDDFEMSDIYISANGRLAAKGTKDDPMSSLTTAFGKLAANGTIHVIGEFTYPEKIVTPVYMEKLTIVGEGEGAKLFINGNTTAFLSDTKLDNFVLDTTYTSAANYLAFNWNNVELTETFDCNGVYRFLAGQVLYHNDISKSTYDNPISASSDKDITVTVNGGTFSIFVGGNWRMSADCPFGTYSGNMTLNIGSGVTIKAHAYNGIGGQNYLSGTVTANINSWPSGTLCRDYPRIGAENAVNKFNESYNTGITVMNFGEGVSVTPIITGDFDGDEKVTFADAMLLLKLATNHDDGSEIHDFYSFTEISLVNVIRALKKLV